MTIPKPMTISTSDMILYGNPASGNAMTLKLMPIAAKNAITQLVQP